MRKFLMRWMQFLCQQNIVLVLGLVTLGLSGCSELFNNNRQLAVINDNTAPTIVIKEPENGESYAEMVTVRGTAVDAVDESGAPGEIVSCTYEAANPALSGNVTIGADGTFDFELDLASAVGEVRVEITAVDHNDNTATEMVVLIPPKSFTSFTFLAILNQDAGLSHDVEAVITDNRIQASVPPETDVRSLIPTFEFSGQTVRMGGRTQTNSQTPVDFSTPVEYEVAANDGTLAIYRVYVGADPLMPTELAAAPVSEREIHLTWVDNSFDEDGFVLQRKEGVDGTFADLADVEGEVTAYVDTALPPATVFQYRIRSVAGGRTSPWSSSVQAQTFEFPSPTILSPSGGTTIEETRPELQWQPVDGAQLYEIQVATDTQELDTSEITIVDDVAHVPGIPLSNVENYQWRVRAVNQDGNQSAWSLPETFRVFWGEVGNMYPDDGDTVANTRQYISCTPVDGAARYQFQIVPVGTDITTVTPIESEMYTCTEIGTLTNYTTYAWRVRAIDGDGQAGPWSSTNELTIQWGAISGFWPEDGDTVETTQPTLNWHDLGYADRYEIQVSQSRETVTEQTETTTYDHAYVPDEPLVNGETYYWRVRAVDRDGQYGAWNATKAVTVMWGSITETHPPHGAIVGPTARLQWSAVPGAAEYELQISLGSALAPDDPVYTTTSTTYSPDTPYPIGDLLNWRVRAKDADGQYGAWSSISSAEVRWDVIEGFVPADGSVISATTLTLGWDAAAEADHYEIQCNHQESGVEDAARVVVPSNEYEYFGSFNVGETVYWRVRAVADDGTTGAWSDVQSVRREAYVVGDTGPAGGVVFYDAGNGGTNWWRYLEAAPTVQSYGVPFGTWPNDSLIWLSGSSVGDGGDNTASLVQFVFQVEPYAAGVCDSLTLGGYSDWFLPSIDELKELRRYRDKVDGLNGWHWSSTTTGVGEAACLDMGGSGNGINSDVSVPHHVRAIRAF